MTARPCGTKKKSAARIHKVIEPGPAFAAVATHEIPMIATKLNRTRSRSLSRRSSSGALLGVIESLKHSSLGLMHDVGKQRHRMKVKRANTSAGLLMFRRNHGDLEVLLVHPGGPFFRNKDLGAWTVPKGEVAEGEELLTRARV